jgi:hypothetical protein
MTKSNFQLNLFAGLVLLMLASTTISAQEATAKSVKLAGQFVCSVCWLEADRKTTAYGTAADMDCAREC